MAKAWAKFPYPDKSFQYTAATLKKSWDRLHTGDAEPFPKSDAVDRGVDRVPRRRLPEGGRARRQGG